MEDSVYILFFLSALFSSACFILMFSYWVAPLLISVRQAVLLAARFSQVSGLMLFFSEVLGCPCNACTDRLWCVFQWQAPHKRYALVGDYRPSLPHGQTSAVGFCLSGYGYLSCQHDGALQCLGLCLANEFSVSCVDTLDGSCLVISSGGCKQSMSHRNRAVRVR